MLFERPIEWSLSSLIALVTLITQILARVVTIGLVNETHTSELVFSSLFEAKAFCNIVTRFILVKEVALCKYYAGKGGPRLVKTRQ